MLIVLLMNDYDVFMKDVPFGVLKIYYGITASQTQQNGQKNEDYFFFLFFLPRNLFVYRFSLTPLIWVTLFVFHKKSRS